MSAVSNLYVTPISSPHFFSPIPQRKFSSGSAGVVPYIDESEKKKFESEESAQNT